MGVLGQKIPKNANVICERPLTHLHELGLIWMLRNICQRSDCIMGPILETLYWIWVLGEVYI